MNYAAPFAYASQSLLPDPYAPVVSGHHQRPARQRRRRMRAMLLPSAMRPARRSVSAPAALARS